MTTSIIYGDGVNFWLIYITVYNHRNLAMKR